MELYLASLTPLDPRINKKTDRHTEKGDFNSPFINGFYDTFYNLHMYDNTITLLIYFMVDNKMSSYFDANLDNLVLYLHTYLLLTESLS